MRFYLCSFEMSYPLFTDSHINNKWETDVELTLTTF
jgi:hypothetical protein